MWAGTGLVGAMCTRHDLNHEAPRNKAGGGTKHGNVLMKGTWFDGPIGCHCISHWLGGCVSSIVGLFVLAGGIVACWRQGGKE